LTQEIDMSRIALFVFITAALSGGATAQFNVAWITPFPLLPDLKITNVNYPNILTENFAVVTVKNGGALASAACTLRLRITTASGTYVYSYAPVPALAAGATTSVAITSSILLLVQLQVLTFKVDSSSVVSESNESNNTAVHLIGPN
jgi:hypothetical protein